MEREIRIEFEAKDDVEYAEVANAVWMAVKMAASGRAAVLLDQQADLGVANDWWTSWALWTEDDRIAAEP